MAEFETHFNLKKLKIKGKDNNEIHGILVSKFGDNKPLETTPTLIFCDGNAGVYEFNLIQDKWTR